MKETIAIIVDIDTDNVQQFTSINMAFNRVLQEITNYETDNLMDKDELTEYLKALPALKDPLQPLLGMTLLERSQVDLKTIGTCSSSNYLMGKGIIIPCVHNKDGLVNGLLRAGTYLPKLGGVPSVYSEHATDNVFKSISASYSLDAAKDAIRQSAFRSIIRWELPYAFKGVVPKAVWGKSVLTANFLKRNFPKVLDFGSGNAAQFKLLRSLGSNITVFEPFAISHGKYSISEAHRVLSAFLDDYEQTETYDMVTLNAVFNSVPFVEDIEKIVVLTKFLATGSKALSVTSRSETFHGDVRTTSSLVIASGNEVDKKAVSSQISSNAGKVKVQNFYGTDDINKFYGAKGVPNVQGSYSRVVFHEPQFKVTRKKLEEAVNFEFGLSHEGRVFKDLRDRAVRIFLKKWDALNG